jgi:hypothetical protein
MTVESNYFGGLVEGLAAICLDPAHFIEFIKTNHPIAVTKFALNLSA